MLFSQILCMPCFGFCQTGHCLSVKKAVLHVHCQPCKQIIGKLILTLVTHSYLSPWPHPLCTALLLWGFCHYSNHDISSVPVVRFCSREGVNEKRKWRIKREAAMEGGEEMRGGGRKRERERELYSVQRGFCWCLDTLASLLYVTRATAVCRPACLRSIACVSLIDEVRSLGQPGHICTSAGNAPPHLSSHFLSLANAAFSFDS